MKLKDKFCDFLNGLVDSRLNNTKKVTTSYVALFLVLSIFAVSTFSWFTIRDTATIDSDTFSLESAAGMIVNKGEEIRNTITVKQAKLKEASSVDGRNMFFPVDRGYGDKGQSVDTSEMKFREGTVGDKNDGYIYSDFTLTGQTGGQVEVYVKSYKVQVHNRNTNKDEVYDGATHITVDGNSKPSTYLAYQNPCPIRIAFIRNSAEASTVIDPTAIIDNYADECQAVSSVNSLGSATTTKAKGRSFSDYYFGTGAPLFTLDGLKSQNITMVAWLEATGENCDAYEGQDVSITVELESNWKDMEYVTFVDKTKGDADDDENTELRWVGNAGCFLVMTYYDENFQNPKSVVMSESKSDGKKPIEWIAYLPKDKITNISFMRYSKVKEKIKLDGTNDVEVGRIYNVWHTTAEVNTWIAANKSGNGEKAFNWSHEINKNGLQTYRTDDGTKNGNKENTYYAVHGNGYGDTPTVAENVAPCIGYWGTTYPNSSGGSVEPTTTEQLPTTGETYARADIQIDYNLWLNEYNSYNGGGGLRNLLSQNVLVLKAVFDSNGTETAYEMKPQGGGDKCVLSKTSVKGGSRLVRFDLYDPAKKDPIIRKYLVPENIQHTFTESAGSNEYIISYSLVNQGSGIVEKAGNW
ncbi:hypothetical protein GMC98_08910 [Ruminococcus bromii]|nr:hypothetical protein [Ruminococcus bromii]MTQ94888.1 hypothetical protein [Ruminococcus bromii]MTR79802.1 hypothetical protein [Ruminococcus bromii]MTR89048.1 hypothetical protein [Ruminococcus bromii]